MKKFIIFLLLSSIVIKINAQQPKTGIDSGYHFKYIIPPDSLNKLIAKVTYSSTPFAGAKFSHVLRNGDKVYILPQDNMPCIVPNRSMYNYNMPVYKGKTEGRIPNASPPVQIIPDTKKKQ